MPAGYPQGIRCTLKPGAPIWHRHGSWSVGCTIEIQVVPADFDFTDCLFRFGAAMSTATGGLAHLNSLMRPISERLPIDRDGKVGIVTLTTGESRPPFRLGDFVWPVPCQISRNGYEWAAFATVIQRMTMDSRGTATLSFGDAGPVTRFVEDRDS